MTGGATGAGGTTAGAGGLAAGGGADAGSDAAGGTGGDAGGGGGAGGSPGGCQGDDECAPGLVCGNAGACVPGCTSAHPCPAGESCCDGQCFDTSAALEHCGGCGKPCPAPANTGVVCAEGACVVTGCEPGFTDCNGTIDDGCEANTATDVLNCGACGQACAPANAGAVCTGGSCGYAACDAGFADCDGAAANGCEVSVLSNVDHCGACGNACSGPGTPFCVNGTCGSSSCPAGLGDCDGDPGNGCETAITNDVAHCGGCGKACTVANGTPSCNGTTCGVASCSSGFADCDGDASNGCETSLKSVAHCGACNQACSPPHATGSCATGTCTVETCAAGYGNCDGKHENGCEASTASNVKNCGGCGVVCSSNQGTPACSAGACQITCHWGYGNCDGNVANGCETPTATNVNHCGTCGNACSAPGGIASCAYGMCGVASCNPGLGNCDGNAANGCETSISSNPDHCGACGAKCTAVNGTASCTGSNCSVTCNSGFANCDGSGANGCEAQLSSDPKNCGACGTVCPEQPNMHYAGACNSGVCAYSTSCSPSYADCDGSVVNGCETSATTNANCGGCGVTCTGGKTCSGGSCKCPAATPTACGGTCVNTSSNSSHCGACNAACTGGKQCNGGVCVCPASTPDVCGGTCVNVKTDVAHCSACNAACPATFTCSNGDCVCPPTAPTLCGGACADLQSSASNCGSCGNACPANHVCIQGACSECYDFLLEDFSDNSAGWQLGAEWEIGKATASSGESYGNPDPAQDHTAGNDNGVAGVVLGGNAAQMVHDYEWLTSPAVNLTTYAGTVTLEFWRWLNSDYTPYMENSVEVWNGTTWINLWKSGSSPGVQDSSWTKVTFDVTPHKNAQFRVRFGFMIGSSGVFAVSQWNVDDVRIRPSSLPAGCN